MGFIQSLFVLFIPDPRFFLQTLDVGILLCQSKNCLRAWSRGAAAESGDGGLAIMDIHTGPLQRTCGPEGWKPEAQL